MADRALVAQTWLGEDYRVGVEWVGRCWVWLTVGESPSLMEVVVSEAEVEGLELWAEFRAEPEPDLRATARGLWEGGKVPAYHRSILGLMRKAR